MKFIIVFQLVSAKFFFPLQCFGIAEPLMLFRGKRPEPEDCEPVIKLCQKVKSSITGMNSRTAMTEMAPANEAYRV